MEGGLLLDIPRDAPATLADPSEWKWRQRAEGWYSNTVSVTGQRQTITQIGKLDLRPTVEITNGATNVILRFEVRERGVHRDLSFDFDRFCEMYRIRTGRSLRLGQDGLREQ